MAIEDMTKMWNEMENGLVNRLGQLIWNTSFYQFNLLAMQEL